MGFDLTVYFAQIVIGNEFMATSKILLDRDTSLFQALGLGDEDKVIPRLYDFKRGMILTYDDEKGRMSRSMDAYGSNLTYCYSLDIPQNIFDYVDCPMWNVPALNFMQIIPSDVPMIFYWH